MTTGYDNGPATSGTAGTSAAAGEQAKQVASVTADESRHVASVAQGEAQRVAQDVGAQVGALWDETSSQLLEQSRAGLERLVDLLRRAGDDLEQMVGAKPGSTASRVAEQAGQWARDLSSRLEGRDPRDLLEEVRDLGRRKPGGFLLGALAAGALAGRAARAARPDTGAGAATPTDATPIQERAPHVADVTSPGDPLTEGREGPSSGPISDVSGSVPGTASGDPLAGLPTPDDLPADRPRQPGG